MVTRKVLVKYGYSVIPEESEEEGFGSVYIAEQGQECPAIEMAIEVLVKSLQEGERGEIYIAPDIWAKEEVSSFLIGIDLAENIEIVTLLPGRTT